MPKQQSRAKMGGWRHTSSWKKAVCFPHPRSQHMNPMAPGSSCVSRTATPSLERSMDCDRTAAIDASVQRIPRA